MSYLSNAICAAIKTHALHEFPFEACGLVVGEEYFPCQNVAPDPMNNFEISIKEHLFHMAKGTIRACVHSHPAVNGETPVYGPSKLDMRSQLDAAIPFALVVTDGVTTTDVYCWGDQLPIPPLIGRRFVHGITDCYSLIRDVYRAGKDLCTQQQIDWPFAPVTLPEVPRDDKWWHGDADLYLDHFAGFGFKQIPHADVMPGDVFMARVRSKRINHGGVMTGKGRVLHHLAGRLSMRDTSSLWAKAADMWIRYHG